MGIDELEEAAKKDLMKSVMGIKLSQAYLDLIKRYKVYVTFTWIFFLGNLCELIVIYVLLTGN